MKFPFFFLFPLFCSIQMVCAQQNHKENELDEEPYFVRHQAHAADSLFVRDVQILKRHGKFEGLDTALLKAPVLAAVMVQEVRAGKKASYRTLIDYFLVFRQSEAYAEFIKGLSLYKELESKKVDSATWEKDKLLFVRMGFTDSDLEDFKAYISETAHQNMTYKEAYTAYMKEIEALDTGKKGRDVESQIGQLLSKNKKIEAIKLVIDTTKCGLKEAKDFIDHYAAGWSADNAPVNTDQEILSLLAQGRKLEAVKLYKESSRAGLAESKDYVEALWEQHQSSAGSAVSKSRDTQIDQLVLNQQGTRPVKRISNKVILAIIAILAILLLVYIISSAG
eukprot:gene14068-17102_t